MGIPCAHAWLEVDGKALRVFRVLPGHDPTLVTLARSPDTSIPVLPRPEAPGPSRCDDQVLPGSASNIHAAANFVARTVLDVLAGDRSPDNHWIFAPEGLAGAAPALSALRGRYGVASFALVAPVCE